MRTLLPSKITDPRPFAWENVCFPIFSTKAGIFILKSCVQCLNACKKDNSKIFYKAQTYDNKYYRQTNICICTQFTYTMTYF